MPAALSNSKQDNVHLRAVFPFKNVYLLVNVLLLLLAFAQEACLSETLYYSMLRYTIRRSQQKNVSKPQWWLLVTLMTQSYNLSSII